jgi:four helix bundle protein
MENQYKYSFEKLEVWQDSRILVSEIYALTKLFPNEEKYGLTNQIQRASISIVSNIAEGVSRKSGKEKIRFIEVAYGSLMEVFCQIVVAKDLNYISDENFNEHKETIHKISNKLNALNRSIKKSLTE